MLFSDYINGIRGFIAMFPSAIVPILMFSLFFYFGLKIFNSFVLNGNWFVLFFAGGLCYAFILEFLKNENIMMVIIMGVPCFFVGKEAYERLAK